ncbi:MAG: acetolactate synthase large subunit [Roseiarcus sp.]|jgi:acetolactate synthase-1/2/3 large subunit
MNGVEAILRTLANNGVEVCFTNPGTSEMQVVSAFDREQRVRPVLCLFEGVATGAADGYARMTGKPASTLLHLGAGLANGSANLHNARRAHSPIVNIVGDHARYHRALDAPLASNIAGLAWPNSIWVKTAETPDEAAALTSEAIAASQTGAGGPATLILPADCAWSEASWVGPAVTAPARARPDAGRIRKIAEALKAAKKPMILLGSGAFAEQGVVAAGRIALRGARVAIDTFVARQPRGAGRYAPERTPYFGEMALASLKGVDLLVLASTKAPVAFFSYPGAPSLLVPESCALETLATPEEDATFALQALADELSAPVRPVVAERAAHATAPTGSLTADSIGISLARHMPEHAIVSDDAVTAGLPIYMRTMSARPHDWLCLAGGAIGQGIPVAVGAAIALSQRKTLCLTGDGAGAYTVQGLWTMARENLDVVVVVFANHAYRILNIELARTKSGVPGPRAHRLLDLGGPRMDWASLAKGFGIPAIRCETADSFDAELAGAIAERGPTLIEAQIG